MQSRASAFRALILAVPLSLALGVGAWADQPAKSGNPVFDQTVDIVNQRFFSQAALPAFNAAASTVVAQIPDLKTADPAVVGEAIDWTLRSLDSSHTGRYTPDQVDYYDLADVFRFALRREIRSVFPPDGEVTYAGIGVATAEIDSHWFITGVYDGGPAKDAGLLAGDEILSVDGQPFAEIGSFQGKTGQTVTLSVRRVADTAPMDIPVKVATIQPTETYLKAISDSATTVDQGGHRIGYIHLWMYTSDQVTRILYDALARGALDNVDGLVLDLRSRWGGAPGDAAETFVGQAADMEVIGRDGKSYFDTFRWHKPVVAIIDAGTRSGMEVLAYDLHKNGVPLVGAPSAGNVVAATAFMLPDNSLLELGVDDVKVDGKRLEGNPVQPDIAVPFDVRYADGRDRQRDAAVAAMVKRLGGPAAD